MTSKTTNKFSPEVRAGAVRMVLNHASEHPSRWAAVTSIAAKHRALRRTAPTAVKPVKQPFASQDGENDDGFESILSNRPG